MMTIITISSIMSAREYYNVKYTHTQYDATVLIECTCLGF